MATVAIREQVTPAGAWSGAWKMVEERSVAADALFVYAVRDYRRLLPPLLPQPPSIARVGGVLRHRRTRPCRRLPSL